MIKRTPDWATANVNLRFSLLLAILLTLAGCASVPFDYPKTESYTSPPDPSTYFGQGAVRWLEENDGQTGVVLLPDGIDALGSRLRMMELAEKSIDAQYFILKNDRAGALFAGKMLMAADRGVKVRLLIDDVFSYGIDQQLTLMDTHPNIEVRLFNPLSRQSFKYWSYLLDFGRANRRMHNKSFTVDNSLSIVGGRNIGEEYFALKQDILFDDYEVLVTGPVVQEVSAGFDNYWNSNLSVPVKAFGVDVDPDELEKWRESTRRKIAISGGIYQQALHSKVLKNLREGHTQPALVNAHMVGDPVEKLEGTVGDTELAVLAANIRERFLAAQKELLIVTPYFIPRASGVELLRNLREKGIRIVVVTNSLASTNHIPVHSGYARYRKQLLRAGVEIWEIMAKNPGKVTEWGHQPKFVTLHSKATAIDRSTIVVGSLNFDPRSILINTEMGLFLESRELGNVFTANMFMDLNRVAYKVDLDEKGKLRWTYDYQGRHEVLHKEPQTSFGRRLAVKFYGVLPIEGQL